MNLHYNWQNFPCIVVDFSVTSLCTSLKGCHSKSFGIKSFIECFRAIIFLY